jgi:hypothetical protein
MQMPSERKSLQDFIVEKYLDWFQQHKTEEDFFEKNWTLTKGTMLCPTALPEDVLKNLCQRASDLAKQKNLNAVEVLFPRIAIESICDDYPDLSQLDIFKICQTHVLSQDAQYLLPVKLLCQRTPGAPTFNPYYNFIKSDQAEVTAEDWQQMIHHSQTTESYQDIIQQITDLEHKTDNLYVRLKQFCTTLRLNDAHGGRGGDLNAGSGAYPAIIGFYEYFNHGLSESEKQKLPQELKKELQLLYAFSTDAEQNKNATEQIATCIGTRRQAIESAMIGHEPMLREIGISGEQQSRLQESLADQKQHLEQIIQSTQYDGREQLSFNQSLLQSLNVQLIFQSSKDLQLLIPLNFAEFKQIVDNNPRLLSCCNFNEFIDWTHHLNAEKIEYLIDKFDMRNLVYHPMHFHEWMLQLDDNQIISALILMAKYLKFQSYDFSFLDFNQILDDMGKLYLIPKLINKLESLGIEEELLFAIYTDKQIKYSTKYLFGDGLRTRLFNLLPKERLLELISAEDRTGKKIMHSITESQLQDIFLNHIPLDRVFDTLRMMDANKKSNFQILVKNSPKILTRLSKDQLAQLLIENPSVIMTLSNSLELNALNKMLELLPEEKYGEVLNKMETSVSTLITIARCSHEAFQLLLKHLSFAKWTELIELYSTKDNISELVKPNRLFEFMTVKGTDQTIFEYIVKTNPAFLGPILKKLQESQGTKLFDNLFSQVNQSILCLAAESHLDSFKHLWEIIPEEKRLEWLIKKNIDGQTLLYVLNLKNDPYTKDILKSLMTLYPEQERLELAKTLVGQSNGESKVYLERFIQVKDCRIDEVIALLQRKCKKYPDRAELIVQYIETLTALKQNYLDKRFDYNQFQNKFLTTLEQPPDLNYYRSRSQSLICLPTNLYKKFHQLRTSIVSHERAANSTALARHGIFQEGGEATSKNKPEKHL